MRRRAGILLPFLTVGLSAGPAGTSAQATMDHPSQPDVTERPDATPSTPFTGAVKPVLYVSDVEAAAAFYRDVLGFGFLGFSEIDGRTYYAEMAAGPLKFGLHEPLQEPHGGWVGHQRLYFRVTDLDAHRVRILDAGGSPSEPVRTSWMDFILVRDPDGHEIVLAVTDPERHETDPWTDPGGA